MVQKRKKKKKSEIHKTMLIQDLFVKNSYKNQQQIYISCYKNLLDTYVGGGVEREGSVRK